MAGVRAAGQHREHAGEGVPLQQHLRRDAAPFWGVSPPPLPARGSTVEVHIAAPELSRNLVVQLPIPPVDPASISLSSGAAPDFPRREHWSATAGTAASEDWAWAYDVAASVVWVRVPSGPEATSVRLSAECRPKAP